MRVEGRPLTPNNDLSNIRPQAADGEGRAQAGDGKGERTVIPLERLRELLGDVAIGKSDVEIHEIREGLYRLGRRVIRAYETDQAQKRATNGVETQNGPALERRP